MGRLIFPKNFTLVDLIFVVFLAIASIAWIYKANVLGTYEFRFAKCMRDTTEECVKNSAKGFAACHEDSAYLCQSKLGEP